MKIMKAESNPSMGLNRHFAWALAFWLETILMPVITMSVAVSDSNVHVSLRQTQALVGGNITAVQVFK